MSERYETGDEVSVIVDDCRVLTGWVIAAGDRSVALSLREIGFVWFAKPSDVYLDDTEARTECRLRVHGCPPPQCPYPSHADDCDCRGMGGDR